MHVCIYIHIHNKYTQYTHILCEQKLILFAINRLTALNIEREREREREREKERVRKRERERFPSENTILLLFYYILYYKHGNSFSEKQHGCLTVVWALDLYELPYKSDDHVLQHDSHDSHDQCHIVQNLKWVKYVLENNLLLAQAEFL